MDLLTLALAHAIRNAEPENGPAPLATVSVEGDPQAERVAQWRPIITEAARRFGIPADWIEVVIAAESGGRTMLDGEPITSSAGAMGLMQLMPATYAEMRERYALGPDPHDPRDNILTGTAYLREMQDRFGFPGLFAAYHAGPGRYAAYLKGEERLPKETEAYLAALLPRIKFVAADDKAVVLMVPARVSLASGRSLFFPLGGHEMRAETTSPEDTSHSDSTDIGGDLFVPLSGASR
ncbi:MAG: lytic transglycosylase domain-containing protein [Parvibaculum sp.]|nr:lytic transglycosylase domain-containing protein [Parvibaculum sp.]